MLTLPPSWPDWLTGVVVCLQAWQLKQIISLKVRLAKLEERCQDVGASKKQKTDKDL